MTKIALGLYGAGGFGREVMSLIPSVIAKLFPDSQSQNLIILFIDDYKKLPTLNGINVKTREEFLELSEYELFYCVTIANCNTRRLVVEKMNKSRAKSISIVFNDVLLMDDSEIGSGSVIMPGSKISTSVKIGKHVHINFNSYIAHDSIVNDFVTISPNVTCCGNTIIGSNAFIGAASVIKQGTPSEPRIIGSGSTLGIGSNLICDLPDGQVYAGNPARKLDT